MSFRWNLHTDRVKNTMIHATNTPKRRPVEYHEGFGIMPAPVLDCTGPIARVISVEYTEIGLNRVKMKYQSGAMIVVSVVICEISIVVSSSPTKTMGRMMLNRNHRKIAPPSAVDRFAKMVEKHIATVRKTNPNSMVSPMNAKYSRTSTLGTFSAIRIPANP